MPNSIQQDPRGPDWPLGLIINVTPGVPLNIMSIVDSTNKNSPNTLVPPNTGVTPAGTMEYTARFQQIIFQAFKVGAASHGLAANTGNIYIVRQAQGTGTGNRDDQGAIVFTLTPGQTFVLAAPANDMNIFSPYRYSIDADNAGDGCLVTGIVG